MRVVGKNFFIEGRKVKNNVKVKRYYESQFRLLNQNDSIEIELEEEFLKEELEVFDSFKESGDIDYAFLNRKTVKLIILTNKFKGSKMNKGLEIREKKKAKAIEKRHTKKPNQLGLVRVITVTYPIYTRINGKNKFDKRFTKEGVQVENRIHFIDGKYIFSNKKGVRIKEISDLSAISEE